ncbi:MAG TPA: hypothetical protein VK841_03195 [Polyangiaceae bacterium]|jgi:hypothetical protein|nr:hypothetical protein [Polyangiaceae bacterium]
MGQTTHSKDAQPSANPDKNLQNEGEGSRSASRRYDEGAEKAAKDPKHVAEAAEKAKRDLEGPKGPELRDADQKGKNHQHR